MNPLSQTTAIIKTFQRPDDLDRLIRSIRRFYPELPILVGDDGLEPSPRDDVEYLRLPPDIGLSAGRNAMLEHVRTPYFVLLEDDFEFSRRTKIEKLVALVDRGKLDIAAGNCFKVQQRMIFFRKRQRPYHGLFRFQDDELQLILRPSRALQRLSAVRHHVQLLRGPHRRDPGHGRLGRRN